MKSWDQSSAYVTGRTLGWTLTAQGHIMTAIDTLLCPEETVVLNWMREADVAACTTCTHDGHLSTVLLSEVGRLESMVGLRSRHLFQLELVDATSRSKGQEQQRRESGENHAE